MIRAVRIPAAVDYVFSATSISCIFLWRVSCEGKNIKSWGDKELRKKNFWLGIKTKCWHLLTATETDNVIPHSQVHAWQDSLIAINYCDKNCDKLFNSSNERSSSVVHLGKKQNKHLLKAETKSQNVDFSRTGRWIFWEVELKDF